MMPHRFDCEVKPHVTICGELTLPGDKSISHRALILSALAKGESLLHNLSQAEDCMHTRMALEALGVSIQCIDDMYSVNGQGFHGLMPPKKPLYMGNSGTSMRLLAGLLTAQPFDTTLIGDASLSQRPMKRIISPLSNMGASIHGNYDMAPLMIQGRALKGIAYEPEVASAQVKSALLLAGLYAKGSTCITEPSPTRDHTERMLSQYGYPIEIQKNTVIVEGGCKHGLSPQNYHIPGDISSAAFFIVAATIVPDSKIVLNSVGVNPGRVGFLSILKRMGADIEIQPLPYTMGEPVADIIVRGVSRLTSTYVKSDEVPGCIDELPILFIAAALAEGETTFQGIEELKYKESNRLAVMVEGLKCLGVESQYLSDSMLKIKGQQAFNGAEIDSYGDHRIAMSFIIAGLKSKYGIRVKHSECINISYPSFIEDCKQLSIEVTYA